MARRKGLSLAEVHAALFASESEEGEESDVGSGAASYDSAEEDAFEDGFDVILDK